MTTAFKKPERSFSELLSGKATVTVDGAMGSQLFERGIMTNVCLEELVV